MTRLVQETWVGVGFDVVSESVPVTDERGNVVHDAHGLPKMQQQTTLVFVMPRPDGQTVVRVPFNEDGRLELLRKLTGGIVVANGNGVQS